MWQWELFPNPIRNIIFEFIENDTWRDEHLSSVSRDWQLIDVPGNRPRRPGGTIVLGSPIYNFGQLNMDGGLTIATLYKLAHHYMQYRILPNHYTRVHIVPNIRDY